MELRRRFKLDKSTLDAEELKRAEILIKRDENKKYKKQMRKLSMSDKKKRKVSKRENKQQINEESGQAQSTPSISAGRVTASRDSDSDSGVDQGSVVQRKKVATPFSLGSLKVKKSARSTLKVSLHHQAAFVAQGEATW